MHDIAWVKFIAILMPLLVIMSNAVLKNGAKFLFGWVGFLYKGQYYSMIQNAVFSIQFFNTAVSILLINANFHREGIFHIFDGDYTDFSDDWFRDVSNLFVIPLIF